MSPYCGNGLTLSSLASLPSTYWDHAFLTVVYLINHLPSTIVNSLHHILFFSRQHLTMHFSGLLDALASLFPRPYNAHKFDFQSQECLFLGYSASHKCYKILSPFNRLYISRGVILNENRFPILNTLNLFNLLPHLFLLLSHPICQ